jgi:glycosyltransferase involved in cell wall biosynthesis
MTVKNSIAFVCHPYHRGGVTRWMADAAVAAANKGYTVYFVTVEPTSEFLNSGGRETMLSLLQPFSTQVKIISQPVGYTFEFGDEAVRATTYRNLILQNIPLGTPIIISDDMAVWSGTCAIGDKYPVIGVLHGDQDYYYDRAKKYHKQLSLCACVSNRVKRNVIAKCYELQQQKPVLIPCGINLPDFKPQPHSAAVARLLFIGRLTDYEKRAYDLAGICAELHKQGIPFHLDIAGNSPESATEYGVKFKDAGVAEYITFHGWQTKDQVQKLLDGSDMLLLTSNSEGMPLVMMEALASGCGFTGTRVSGIEDYEKDPRAVKCLSVYTVGDIKDAATKIRLATTIPVAERQRAARKLAEAEFSMDVCLDRYFKAIDTLKPGGATAQNIKLSAIDKLLSNVKATGRFLKVKMMGRR